jgi:hypothetical protein
VLWIPVLAVWQSVVKKDVDADFSSRIHSHW